MLKFIKHTMDTIVGVEIFPIISFLIFFIFFIVLFFWVSSIKKTEINKLASLPLESENEGEINNQKTSEV